MDLLHVKIEAMDSNGLRDMTADSLLRFKINGEADIVGVINGDMNSNELTVGDSRKLFKGSATVIIKSRRKSGKVTLCITSNDFPTLKKTFTIK